MIGKTKSVLTSDPIRAIVDRCHSTRESFRCDATTELERFHLCVIRTCAISVSDYGDPTERQSKQRDPFQSLLESTSDEQTLSAEPVARIYSENGLNDKQFTSAPCASTTWDGFEQFAERVSQLKEDGEKVNDGSRSLSLHHQFTIVTNRAKQCFMKEMPSHVLVRLSACFDIHVTSVGERVMVVTSTTAWCPEKMANGSTNLPSVGVFFHIPQTDGVIVGGWQDLSTGDGIPGKSIAFFRVSSKTDFWTLIGTERGQLLFG